MHGFNEIFIQILALLTVSLTVIALTKLINKPYSISLVIVGLLLGLTEIPFLEEAEHFIVQSEVFQVIIISLFLPVLLGDASLKLSFLQLKKEKGPIVALALVGTFLSYILIGIGAHFLVGLSVIVSFTFASLMSATDPISVISIFKTLGVPKKLVTIIEGESLFNDGVAVVLFQISTLYLLSYLQMGWMGLGQGLVIFLKFSLGGIFIGGVAGFIFSQIIRAYDDFPLEIAFSIVMIFGSYFIAEHFHVSGVIAVVVAGLIFGNYGARVGMSNKTKMNIDSFFDTITFFANSLIFLMIGLEIKNIDLSHSWGYIVYAIAIVLISRTIAVYLSLALIKGFSKKYKPILNWGGLKGSLSIALALSLPRTFEGRDEILIVTFSVVLFSLLVQGLTITPLITKLKVKDKENRTT